MAMRSGPAFICRFLLLLATFPPLTTEVYGDPLQVLEVIAHSLDMAKDVHEIIQSKSWFEKLTGAARTGSSQYDWWEDKVHQMEGAVDDDGRKKGAVQPINIGNQKFHVHAVDVGSMVTWTSTCGGPGLSGPNWAPCNAPYCPGAAAGQPPPYQRNTATWPTWALSRGPVALEGAAAARQQAPAFYMCRMPSQGVGRSPRPRAVLGLGLAGALPQSFQRFSYHLGSGGQMTSVWLGGGPAPAVGRPTATIRLIGTKVHPGRYYVDVTSIWVDGRRLDGLPPGVLELNSQEGTGGVYMSSDPFDRLTYLNRAVYERLVGEFRKRLGQGAPTIYAEPERLCYTDESLANKVIPKLALVFDNGGAVWELKTENYWGPEMQMQCLAIAPSPSPTGESVLGSQLQWGWRMTYDIGASVLHATPEPPAAAATPFHFPPPTTAAATSAASVPPPM